MNLRSIRSRLLALVLAAVTPFAALIGIGLWGRWHDVRAAALEQMLNDARLLAVQVDDHFGNIEYLLAGLSLAVSADSADLHRNDALLRQVKAGLPDFIGNMSVLALDGENIGTSTPDLHRTYHGHKQYFRQVLAGERVAIGSVVRSRIKGEWVVPVAAPIHDHAGRLAGVLVVATKLERFQDALTLNGLPAGTVVRIVDEHGIVVAQSMDGSNWIGKDLSGSAVVARHLRANDVSEFASWPDGIERITGSSTAHRVPWLVSVGLPTNVAYATLVWRFSLGAFLCLAALLTATSIAWIYSRRVVLPLQQLERDATNIAAGRLEHRSSVATRDEVGKLAQAFNRMAAAIERRRDQLRQAKETLAAVSEASPVAIFCSGPDRRIVQWNRVAQQLYAVGADQAIGAPVMDVPPWKGPHWNEMIERAYRGQAFRDAQFERIGNDGKPVEMRIAAGPMYKQDGTLRGIAWAAEDVSDQKRAEEQLKHLAHYDPLTGLPNRLLLWKELGSFLDGDGEPAAVSIALFDLDGFKEVNDTLGHSIGDQLLIEVGKRLSEVEPSHLEQSQVFRLGGDEFVVSIKGCGDPLIVGGIIKAMLNRLAEPFAVNEHALHVGGSAGIAIAPNDGSDVEELLANADLALYRAKSDGGRTCRFFEPVFRAEAQARRALDLDLRRAFAAGEFELYYQPQIKLADDTIVGAEALLRWNHPDAGVLAPGAFIETLTASLIAQEVGSWIIREACRQAAAWHSAGFPFDRIAVNLFPSQLRGSGLLDQVLDALSASGLPPHALELEITENVALDQETGMRLLQRLRAEGIAVAFDDFGTGYASLSNLRKFPLTRVKIDRSFVRRITDSGQDAAIVRSLIVMAHNLGLSVTAEGVETSMQAAFLSAEYCEEAQGFLYGKPVPAADFEQFLRTSRLAARRSAS